MFVIDHFLVDRSSVFLSPRSHDYHQTKNSATNAEMDLSVLWCLGPDFDKQTVLSLLGDHQYPDSIFMQPTTPTWLMSSPSQWNISSMHEPPVYTPRSVMSELGGPQSPNSGANKRPFSDVSNRATCKKFVFIEDESRSFPS